MKYFSTTNPGVRLRNQEIERNSRIRGYQNGLDSYHEAVIDIIDELTELSDPNSIKEKINDVYTSLKKK